MTIRRYGIVALAAGLLLTLAPRAAVGQEPRLVDRLAEPYRSQVDAVLDSARAADLPTEPLVDRALEGASKAAAGERIVAAVRRLAGELRAARAALGPRSGAAEIVAGASAIRAGAAPADLARLRALRRGQSLTVAAAVLADLVAVGVPADSAVAAVLALAQRLDDAEYVAFRRNVERDIALGASPVAALGVRLTSTGEGDQASATPGDRSGGQAPRKP